MHVSEMDELADFVVCCYSDLQDGISKNDPFPDHRFNIFFKAVLHYTEAARDHPMLHRKVASAVNNLTGLLNSKSWQAPEEIQYQAKMLNDIVFPEVDRPAG